MRSGRLDRTISIQRQTETVSVSGAVVTTWANVATVRAEIIQASAAEFLAAFGEGSTAAVVFRIRWLAGVTNTDRVLYEGHAYNLKRIVEIGRRRGLELHCERIA